MNINNFIEIILTNGAMSLGHESDRICLTGPSGKRICIYTLEEYISKSEIKEYIYKLGLNIKLP
ncbi:MAG: hypothetical protein PSX81_09445 [bacterium]|nr:hypothetical protein [bacterium]